MMTISDKRFLELYVFEEEDDAGELKQKLHDHFQTKGTKLLPFILKPTGRCEYDGNCGLNGVTGEFYRIKTQNAASPIYSVADTEETVRERLKDVYKMPTDDIERFISVFKDVMFENNTLSIADPSFFAFIPMKFFGKDYDEVQKVKKYRAGQPKIADYYVSIAELFTGDIDSPQKDIFCSVVSGCLQEDKGIGASKIKDKYFVFPFIKEMFAKDLTWLLNQKKSTIIEYLPSLLYFYACFSLMQTLVYINKKNWDYYPEKALPFYYMLSSETASKGHLAVKSGWSAVDRLPDSFLNKMSSYSQCLDILNSMFEEDEELLSYQDILKRFETIEFDEKAKAICENILDKYQTAKRYTLSGRRTETGILPDPIPTTVDSFNEFVDKLLNLCIALQSKDYPAMQSSLYQLVKIKLLEKRKEYKVLSLDEEMLVFLVALATKDERIRLDELYSRLERYGLIFSFQTKNVISECLLKLNLLDRKSDSGEAQYVRVVL